MAVIPALLKRIEELEALVKQNSSNSSRPPSSDPPGAPDRPAAASTGRKRGGQPGHVKHERELVPEAEVTRATEVLPEECEVCHEPLHGVDPTPKRHQVFELPEMRADVDEFRLHRLGCDNCGHFTRAPLPSGVPTGQFGPRLTAFLAACTGHYYLSRRQAQQMAQDLVGVKVSLGAITDIEQAASEAVAEPTVEAAEHVKVQPSAHADETGWRIGNAKTWLWTAVTRTVAVFIVARSRGSDVAKQLMGESFAGFLHSDRWCGYAWVSVVRRQLCWAHLLRHFRMFQDYSGETRRIGEELEHLTGWMFTFWHKVRNGTLDRATFIAIMDRLGPNLLALLEQGRSVPVRKVASMCREILALQPALFTFVTVEGLEPTNNRAERAIRPAVLWRKRSFGNDSEAGARFTERMLAVTATLRLQNRNVLQFLTQCCQAALLNRKPPSLLPANLG